MTFDDEKLNRAFLALGDQTRRQIIVRLAAGPATVNELAEPFKMSVQGISKHIQVLEQAHLVTRTREAQRRPVHLNPALLAELTGWIDKYRLLAEQKYNRLDALLRSQSAPRG
ncbi:helix-turn-helix transcriptional regulator [Paeniglutamicibacter sp. Y32M11]|uniref:ArsR/SmtB family transcription factor n=1 Tax=Paeniglutamicibacter sp. Y32M11 TaxID=2853258 RepID=UPI001C53222B|nr:metalloregulator ArsR/SmtB family transcription factor [Paeniglutamicibacter sp. Y32M11]QXQ10961.1 metalloregulator ArsR/SmtB family transcription factor [Paeniglutamicibacter sp. Y32M11]